MGIGGASSPLIASVTAKVRNLAPHSANRWTDAQIRSMIHVADMVLCEQAEIKWTTKDIALTVEATYFSVPTDVIWIGAVLYSEDGTDFDDGVLWPATTNELDQLDPRWAETTGTQPRHYILLSAPGLDGARIGIYPQMSSTTAEAIRLVCLACRPSDNLTMVSLIMPEKVEDVYYVPMVMALLYGGFDINTASHYYGIARQGINLVRGMYANRSDDVFYQSRTLSPSGGQLA